MAPALRNAITGSLLLLLAAGPLHAATTTGTLSVAAVVLSKSNCQFDTTAAAIPFGTLDPMAATDVTVTATVNFACRGSAPIGVYMITDDDGLHESAANANRMQNSVNPAAHLPYSLTLSNTFGSVPRNVVQTLTITGKIRGIDYQTAQPGYYTDTVTLTIVP